VRKAEVPAPSTFNRRVTAELDAIVLKALTRDVADRYQTAQQLAQELDALIAGYRFDPKELRQFIRQLFRKEYSEELEESEVALDAQPGMHRARTSQPTYESNPSMPSIHVEINSERTPIPATPPPKPEPGPQPGPLPTPPLAAPADNERPKGFWGSIFKRKK
jgi:eukaryotic-like serine/threonine-protein kinase